jgi:hypothetical protein
VSLDGLAAMETARGFNEGRMPQRKARLVVRQCDPTLERHFVAARASFARGPVSAIS